MSDPVEILEAIVTAMERVAAGDTVTIIFRPNKKAKLVIVEKPSPESEAANE